MSIRIISVGKKHDSLFEGGIEYYSKRLRKPFSAEWVLLPHSLREGLQARQDESRAILNKLAEDDYVLVLDERGNKLSSPAFSQLLQDALTSHGRVTIVIGGAYGVDNELRARAQAVVSLSDMVFPHQLVRLILAEQLYRADQIARGTPYHHD